MFEQFVFFSMQNKNRFWSLESSRKTELSSSDQSILITPVWGNKTTDKILGSCKLLKSIVKAIPVYTDECVAYFFVHLFFHKSITAVLCIFVGSLIITSKCYVTHNFYIKCHFVMIYENTTKDFTCTRWSVLLMLSFVFHELWIFELYMIYKGL